MIRQKETVSGGLLEIDFYPVNAAGSKLPKKEPQPKTKAEIEAQKKYEQKRAIKRVIRMINANFDKYDLMLSPTYDPMYAPLDMKRAEKDIKNYFDRIKRLRKSELKKVERQLKEIPRENPFLVDIRNELLLKRRLLRRPFKYFYVIEQIVYQTGMFAGMPNYHFHVFMTGGLSTEQVEKKWHKGIEVNATRYKPEMFGPERAAKYIAKDPQGKRRFRHSKNCVKYTKEKIKDNVFKRKHLEKLCKERVDDKQYWERKYKGYQFLKSYPLYNPYNDQWYCSVIMYKADGTAPPWKIEDWAVA